MCKQCVDAVKKHWPDLPENQWTELLMSCTAFPFAGPDYIEKQLAELAKKTGCDLGAAMAIVDAEMMCQMDQQ